MLTLGDRRLVDGRRSTSPTSSVLAVARLVLGRPPAHEADGELTWPCSPRAVGRAAARRSRPARPPGCCSTATTSPTAAAWYIFASGFLEPVLYLFSIGVGVGAAGHRLRVQRPDHPVRRVRRARHARRVGDERLAARRTFNFFFKLKYNKLFDQMLATPLTTMDIARGELSWSLLRGGIYSAGFLLVMVAMDLVSSWWAVLVVRPRC